MAASGRRDSRGAPFWRLAQALSVGGLLALVALLVQAPEWGLYLTWWVLVPVLPALFLTAPLVWRNLCPIAVIHQLPRRLGFGGIRRLAGFAPRWSAVVAMVGLFLIVPLRHVALNQQAPPLVLLLVGILGMALLGGILFQGKSGWCSTVCPVGPVERLYGQEPLLSVDHAHCGSCLRCTEPCFDRKGPRAVLAMAGEPQGARRMGTPEAVLLWSSPVGTFAAAFPGFVLGYFAVAPGAGLPSIYLQLALYSAASLLTLVAVQTTLGWRAGEAMKVGAAAAAGIYYWYTVPQAVAAAEATWLGPAPGWVSGVGLVTSLGFVTFWFWNAIPSRPGAG
jgi:nitrite reductase (NADH) large subunit